MARETEHCGQKQIRWAADFWRGLIPTVCANIYTATDLCPASSSRLQRRQYKLSKSPPGGPLRPTENTVAATCEAQVCRRIPTSATLEKPDSFQSSGRDPFFSPAQNQAVL